MMRRLWLFIQLLLLCAAPLAAGAAPFAEGRNTALQLLADRDALVPGQAITLAVDATIRDKWHIYWRNPGDSGDKLRLTWDLPQGFQAGDIGWPVPERLPYGPLLNFGYTDHAVFPLTLIVPPNIDGHEVTLKARAEILVCEDICIPEFEDLSLTLPVREAASPANEDVFTKARDSLPEISAAQGGYMAEGDQFVFVAALDDFKAAHLFPFEWGMIDNPSKQNISRNNGVTIVTVKRGDRDLSELKDVRFLLSDARGRGVELVATPGAIPAPTKSGDLDLLQVFAFAVLGGLLLNLMPCVFPVLSMKTLSLIKLSNEERVHAQKSALAYTAGILVSFAALSVALLVLRGAGEAVGWGFQLQLPVIVTLLAWVTASVGFNLLGFFDINGFGNVGAKLARGTGLTASFFTGVLAAIVATPCTAPFMAGALGAALTQPPAIAVAIVLALGFGLALPFLLISFIPALARHLPRPGAWMERFKQFLAFPMFAASVWLVWVAASQIGADSIWIVLGGLLIIGFLVWLARLKPTLWTRGFAVLFWLALLGLLCALPMAQKPENENMQQAALFSEEVVKEAVAQNRPVFVYLTAKWCVTCLLNERVALDTPDTQKLFQDTDTLVVKGDWTNYDPMITDYLNRHGRQGVPLYVLYKDGKETVLPQLLTPAIVADAYKGEIK